MQKLCAAAHPKGRSIDTRCSQSYGAPLTVHRRTVQRCRVPEISAPPYGATTPRHRLHSRTRRDDAPDPARVRRREPGAGRQLPQQVQVQEDGQTRDDENLP